MRLPYLQVSAEAWSKARVLGGLLHIGRREAFGLLCDLWKWSLELGPKDGPPTGEVPGSNAALILAAALEWGGDPELLVTALCEAGVDAVARMDGGLRVRGTRRYASAFDNAQARSSQAKRAAAARWRKGAPDADSNAPSMLPASPEHALSIARALLPQCPSNAKTYTQTQTKTQEKKGDAPAARAPFAVALIEQMGAAFLTARGVPYAQTHHDDAAMRRLLGMAQGSEAEVLRRWGVALAWRGFPACSSLAQLAQHWNHYAQPQPEPTGPPARPQDIRRGVGRVDDDFGTPGVTHAGK